ncbi:MAG TPA: ATP-binding protein [Gemmataceae bacterium]|nr:ATP-binding protein [Gemmataceae bacterium]
MASRWRIRHKLMLGLGLVVATMVLLLGGTIFGMWSYYLDMKNLREWTEIHQHQAEECRAAVADIKPLIEKQMGQKNDWPLLIPPPPQKERETTEQGKQAPLLPEEKSIARKDKPPETPEEAIERASKKLAEYEAKLIDPNNHELPPSTPDSLKFIRTLLADLDKLNLKWGRSVARTKRPPLEVEMAPNVDDQKINGEQWQEWDDALAKLARDSRDLCRLIDTDIRSRIDASRRNYQITFWIAFPASIIGLLLVSGLLGSFYSWVFHPIRDLEAGVVRVAKGDLAHRIDVHSGDEMEDLGAAFNDMMQRLQDLYSDLARQVNERSRQLIRSERLASVGFLAAGVAHEINNPLASIAFCSEALEARLSDLLRHLRASGRLDEEHEIFSKYLKMIQEEAFRCKNITERLLAFSRPGERRREQTDLRELVQLVLDVTQHLPNHRGKEIQFEMSAERLSAGGAIAAWVNSEEIKSVVLNLVVNALDSMDEGGKLTIRLGQRGDMAELQFSDTGCGMTQEVLENIFEPFYTRSRTGKGTGLGLTISHRIITQHGGEIEASSPGLNLGSTFIVRLPVNVPEDTPLLPGPGLTDDKSEEHAAPARAA